MSKPVTLNTQFSPPSSTQAWRAVLLVLFVLVSAFAAGIVADANPATAGHCTENQIHGEKEDDEGNTVCVPAPTGRGGSADAKDAATDFWDGDLGKLVNAVARVIAILVVLFGAARAVAKGVSSGGTGALNNALKSLIAPLLMGAILFNLRLVTDILAWAISLVGGLFEYIGSAFA